jgi:hypothetical protein
MPAMAASCSSSISAHCSSVLSAHTWAGVVLLHQSRLMIDRQLDSPNLAELKHSSTKACHSTN